MSAAPECLELFAGGGFAALGVERAGFKTAALVEIDKQAQCVLRAHFDAPILDDVRTTRGNAWRGLSLVRGGSPCQDVSVAGKRAGLTGERSALFFEQVRIWRESDADLCLWENVDGAMSSNDGRDFGRVLSSFVGGAVPVPRERWRGARKPWPSAGVVSGPSGVAAWRVLDAQFVSVCDAASVPQRRARVFVLCSRTGRVDPAQILLEPQELRGHLTPRQTQKQKHPANTRRVARSSRSNGVAHEPIAFHLKQEPTPDTVGIAPSIGTQGMAVLVQHVPDVADTLGTITGGVRSTDLDGIGAYPVVAFSKGRRAHTVDDYETWDETDVANTLNGFDLGDVRTSHIAVDLATHTDALAPTLGARDYKGPGNFQNGSLQATVVVAGRPRRLTPREYERLMGAPDDWTLVPGPDGALLKDTPRYRIIGNGEVVQQAQWIAERIRWALEEAR